MKIGDLTVTISVANDAGITPAMVQALEDAVDNASEVWRAVEGEALAREAIRRLRIVVCGVET